VIGGVNAPPVETAIETVWREESARVIAGLTRVVRDLSLAEDLAHDALVAALQQWPADGIPRNPGAWLMTAAKHRAIDHLRRKSRLARKHEELARDLEAGRGDEMADLVAAMDEDIGDDVLRLFFTACHPVLSPEARVALTLRLIGGLTTAEIARAFLVPEPTIAQRIVRAKRTIAKAKVPFEVPRGAELSERLSSVLDAVYLVFNEGYSATAGDDWVRPALCQDALRLGRVLADLMPDEPEVHGLLALMELQASRLAARVGPTGEAIRLQEQDRAQWDHAAIARGVAALSRADRESEPAGPYTLQAAIAAVHARARSADETDWARIADLYAHLVALTGSPVVRLNHAVAVAMSEGAEAGLTLLDELLAEGSLATYHYAPSVRGDLLERLGRHGEARAEFERAAALATNARERELLQGRALHNARGSES
jgi:RNA polymerase sigma factor (sigma-70 family)